MELNEIKKQITKIVESNCEEIPYEGIKVDKQQMISELYQFVLKHHTNELKNLVKSMAIEDSLQTNHKTIIQDDEDHLSSLMYGVDNNQ